MGCEMLESSQEWKKKKSLDESSRRQNTQSCLEVFNQACPVPWG